MVAIAFSSLAALVKGMMTTVMGELGTDGLMEGEKGGKDDSRKKDIQRILENGKVRSESGKTTQGFDTGTGTGTEQQQCECEE